MAFDAQQGSQIIDMGFHKIPALNVSSLKYLSCNFRFIVTLNTFTFGFKSVSGLSVSRELRTIEEGGVNDHGILVGQPDNSSHTLSFSRGLMLRFPESVDKLTLAAALRLPGNSGMAKLLKLMASSSISPQASLEKGPAYGTIMVYDRNGNLRGKYSFISFGITEWRVSDLDATDNGLLIEDLTIAHTGLTREPLTVLPASMTSISGISGASRADENAKRAEEKLAYQKNRKKWAEKLGDLEKEKEKKQEELEKINELNKKLANGELDEAAIAALSGVSDEVKKMLKQSLKDKKVRDQREADTKAREEIRKKIRKGEEFSEADMEGMSEAAKEAFKKELAGIDAKKSGALRDEAKRQELDEYTKNLEDEKSWKAEDAQKASEEQEAKNAEMRSKQIENNTRENYEKARDERKAQIEEQNAKRAEQVAASEQAKAEQQNKIKEHEEKVKENQAANLEKVEKVKEKQAAQQEKVNKYLESTKEDRRKANTKARELRAKHEKQAAERAKKDKEARKELDKYTDSLNTKKEAKANQQQQLADKQNEENKKNREKSMKED